LQYCGLTQTGSICFNHQIKKCNGICADLEEIEFYNVRAKAIIAEYTFTHPNFIVFDQGRRADEKSFVMLRDNKFVGYGFIDSSESISGPEQLQEFISSDIYLPDAEILIRGWMKQNIGKFKVVRY
jgi:DNA polymerase-3 subunit epsilon